MQQEARSRDHPEIPLARQSTPAQPSFQTMEDIKPLMSHRPRFASSPRAAMIASSQDLNSKVFMCLRSPESEFPGSKSPELDSRSRRTSARPGQAGVQWSRTSSSDAIETAHEQAMPEGAISPYMEERRAIRASMKREHKKADSRCLQSSFFTGANGPPHTSSSIATLNKLFDKYRDNPAEEPDRIGVEGSMRYLQDLGVQLDEPALLCVLTELDAPTMGEFTRDGFVNGWSNMRADTLSKQQQHIPSLRNALPITPALFKKTYKATFLLARAPGQKILPLDTAIEYWRLLLSAPSLSWSTPTTPWLQWWIEFLEEKWKKSVSRDMWDQTGVFVSKCGEDESMEWWSEEGAWPGVIDDFVGFVRAKRGAGEEMDVG